jgi:hypothetical protein
MESIPNSELASVTGSGGLYWRTALQALQRAFPEAKVGLGTLDSRPSLTGSGGVRGLVVTEKGSVVQYVVDSAYPYRGRKDPLGQGKFEGR